MDAAPLPAITLTWPMIVAAALVIVAALETRLRMTFATTRELNGWGRRLKHLETVYLATQETAVRGVTLATQLDERQEQHRQWIAETVIKTLDRVAATQEMTGREMAAIAAIVGQQGKLLDRISQRLDR